jgi:hypothetical protein
LDTSLLFTNQALFTAMGDQVTNCGQAPAMLFKSSHPQRIVVEQKQLRGILTNVGTRRAGIFKKENFSRVLDRWLPLQPEHPVWKEFRLVNGVIEGKKQRGIVIRLLSFPIEIGITAFAFDGTWMATGHFMPVVHLWKMGEGLSYGGSLLVHLSPVSVITLIPRPWQLVAVGHADGAVSLFSWPSRTFLRVLEGQRQVAVSLICVAPTSGDILVGQNELLTMWTPNGHLVGFFQLSGEVIDVAFTAFSEGVLDNLLFVLYASGSIATLAAHDLEILSDIIIEKENPVSLALGKTEKTIIVTHADGGSTTFRFD